MHGFVFKNDRNENIIIISGCINDKKKFQVGSRKKKRNVKVSQEKNLTLGVRLEYNHKK